MKEKNQAYFYYEHTVNFSIPQYTEMLIIHLLAYTIFGPFMGFYSLIFRKSAPWLMNNLQLTRFGSRGHMIQQMGWAFNCVFFYQFFTG